MVSASGRPARSSCDCPLAPLAHAAVAHAALDGRRWSYLLLGRGHGGQSTNWVRASRQVPCFQLGDGRGPGADGRAEAS
eukprot:1934774-Prymnesium_polylepis.1